MTIWTDDPEIRCQRCTRRFSIMNTFEVKVDAERECPYCGAILVFVDEELTRRWSWSPKAGLPKSADSETP